MLAAAGFRVITMDLRGLGDSSIGWSDYSAASVGGDIVALIEQLGISGAFVVGNSMAGAAAVWASAERPGSVVGLVLIDPFVRDMPDTMSQRIMMPVLGLAMVRPWGPSFWSMYYGSLYKSAPPADLDAYRARLVSNLKEPGRIEAAKAMVFAATAPLEAGLGEEWAAVLVLQGPRGSVFTN